MYGPDDLEPLRRSRWWVRVVATLVAASLLLFTGIYAANFFFAEDPPVDDTVDDPSDPADVPARALGCGPTTSVAPVDDSLSQERQLRQIERRVERLRRLRFEEPVTTEFLSPREVAAEVREVNLSEYSDEELDRDERILRTMGLLPRDMELGDVLDTLSGQVAGFFDPRTGRMVVSSGSGGLDPAAELTLAHELQHALADQVFTLPLGQDVPGEELDADLARRALVEGDATLLQQHYAAAAMSAEDTAAILTDPATQDALEDLADIPYPIQRSFEFPYVQGLAFVCELYSDGGWEAVDAAYRNQPTTTAQVLFPHRYRSGEGAERPEPLGKPGGKWRKIDTSALGAADLLLLFQAPGGDPGRALDDPLGAASGWAGGSMDTYASGRATAVGLSLVERRPGDGLCAAVRAWYVSAFPGDVSRSAQGDFVVDGDRQDAVVRCSDRSVVAGIAPDVATAAGFLASSSATVALTGRR